jgi:hypothetical protein
MVDGRDGWLLSKLKKLEEVGVKNKSGRRKKRVFIMLRLVRSKLLNFFFFFFFFFF